MISRTTAVTNDVTTLLPSSVRNSAKAPSAIALPTTRSSITGVGTLLLSDATRQRPELALQQLDPGGPFAIGRCVGHHVGERDRRIGVLHQQRKRRVAFGFAEQLRTEIRGSDVVGFLDDERASRLVTAYRHRQTERQQQADQAQQRSLDHAHGLVRGVRPVATYPPDEDAGGAAQAPAAFMASSRVA